MSEPHPLADWCTATSKSTGERCRIRVIGGGPCRLHGGSAPQVRAKREARILAAEAQLEVPVTAEDSANVLTSAMNDAHAILQRLKVNIAQGRLEVGDLTALGEWIDRVTRVGKAVSDAGIDERQVRLAEDQGRLVALVIKSSFAAMLGALTEALSERDDAVAIIQAMWTSKVNEIVPRELRALGSGELQ